MIDKEKKKKKKYRNTTAAPQKKHYCTTRNRTNTRPFRITVPAAPKGPAFCFLITHPANQPF